MTNSEIMCLMCGGMATIAGGVLAFIGILGEEFCNTFNGICNVCPAAVVAAKILVQKLKNMIILLKSA